MFNATKGFCAIALLIAGVTIGPSAVASSTVYEISNRHQKLYLAGTLHLLREQDFPLPKEFDAAYQQAQKIYFETDLQKTRSAEFGQRLAQSMLLPNQKTLKDVLHPDIWKKLQAWSQNNQFPLEQAATYNPVMLSILMLLNEMKKLGVGEGVDSYYDQIARKDNKYIGELENADDVIDYMKIFTQEDPNKIINSSLDDMINLPADLDSLIEEWKIGDLDALDKEMAEKMRRETPQGYRTLVINRNKKWLPQIKAMLKTPEIEMVMVGSLHLSGEDGLLKMLEKNGYSVNVYSVKARQLNSQ